jgi:5-methylcytosine-specific restriction endonuclease McrA
VDQYDRLFAQSFIPQWMIRQRQAENHVRREIDKLIEDRAELEYRVSATKSHNKIVAQCVGNEYHNMIQPSKPCKYCQQTEHFSSHCPSRPRAHSPCRHCGATNHPSYKCFRKPENAQNLAKVIKRSPAEARWLQVRRSWFTHHNADSYNCYICDVFMLRADTTLDHVQPRGSHPHLRYEEANLEPCCVRCQGAKGSKSLAYYLAERDKQGQNVSPYARMLAARIVGDVSVL